MPVPKRYFHVSQELNHDAELWEFTKKFGDRSLRTWLQILVFLDRSENQWRLSGDWSGTLSRMVRQSSATVSRQVGHLLAIGWLTAVESSADGSPLVLRAHNWVKYNRTREHKRSATNPDQGADRHPLLSSPFPTPSLSVPTPKIKNKKEEENKPLRASVVNEDFFLELKKNPAYAHIDMDRENGKMDAWLALPKNKHRKKTRAFVLNWVNKIDPPIQSAPAPPQQKCAWSNGGPCESYAISNSRYCAEHKAKLTEIQNRKYDAKASALIVPGGIDLSKIGKDMPS